MKLYERLQACREALDLSQDDIANYIGVSQPAYQRIEKGGVNNPKYLNKIAEIFKTTPEWLKFGAGNPPPYLKMNTIPAGKIPFISWDKVEKWVENYDVEALIESHAFRVGNPVGDPLNSLDYISIGDKSNKKQFALKIKGDAMTYPLGGKRTFLEGETIIIDPEITPKNMDYVIALQKGSSEAIFKQYVIDGNNEYLRPLNPQYPLITRDERVKICGVVVMHLDVLI